MDRRRRRLQIFVARVDHHADSTQASSSNASCNPLAGRRRLRSNASASHVAASSGARPPSAIRPQPSDSGERLSRSSFANSMPVAPFRRVVRPQARQPTPVVSGKGRAVPVPPSCRSSSRPTDSRVVDQPHSLARADDLPVRRPAAPITAYAVGSTHECVPATHDQPINDGSC